MLEGDLYSLYYTFTRGLLDMKDHLHVRQATEEVNIDERFWMLDIDSLI
jgi:hypothetical protein